MSDDPLVNPYRSSTLDYCERAGLERPKDIVACVDCPAGIWHRSEKEVLTCFCTLFHRNTWVEGIDPVLQCDGREAAIAKVISEKTVQLSR